MATPGERPDDVRSGPTPVVIAEYDTYSRAEAALDRLTGQGLPNEAMSLVWSRLRQIEPAAPHPVTASGVLEGALAGASVGGLSAILLSLFVRLQDGMSVVGVVATWTLAFAALGALGRIVVPLLGRDRQFAAGAELAAESYQLWVDEELAARATAILGAGPATTTPDAGPAQPSRPAPQRAPSKPAIHTTAATLLGAPTSPRSAGRRPPNPGAGTG